MTDEDAVVVDGIGAHALQRWGVGVEGDRGICTGVAYAVDVGWGEVKRLVHGVCPLAWWAADRKAVLADRPAEDRHRARGAVVVVKPGVVIVHPADQPHGQVIVTEQLLVQPLGGVVLDVVDPQLRPVGELGDESLELGPREVASGWSRNRREAWPVDWPLGLS